MTTQDAFTIATKIVKMMVKSMENINACQKRFIVHLIPLVLGIKGRNNFLQLSRYGVYSEKTYRNQYEKDLDFVALNDNLITEYCSEEKVIAFDPSYLPKSGKHTPGLGYFYSGVAGSYKKGLEIGCLAVIDIKQNTAYHFQAIQSPSKSNRKKEANQETLIDFYAKQIVDQKEALLKHSSILAVDGFFAKKKFVDKLTSAGFSIVSRLRSDANLRYIFKGVQARGKGRPRKYDGKIDLANIDRRRIKIVWENQEMSVSSAVVYSIGLNRAIRICITDYKNITGQIINTVYYFSTKVDMDPIKIVTYYKSRFQIEFLIRDAKQNAGLENCQSTSVKKMKYHINASLTSVSVAKAVIRQRQGNDEEIVLSIQDIKTEIHNRLLAELIFSIYGFDLKLLKNNSHFQKVLDFGKIAA